MKNRGRKKMQTNNVIGPIKTGDWRAMRMIRENVEYMQSLNQEGLYTSGIEKEKNIYKEVLKPYLSRAN